MYHTAEQQMQNAAKNIDGAIDYIINSQNEHPNRLDVVAQGRGGSSQSNTFAKSNSFQGGSSNTTQNPFGAPSQPSSSFQSASTTSAQNPFGAPSQTAPNPFGRPSQGSAFGAPSQSGLGSTFGAPSQPSAFGAPSSSSNLGTFGQPAALGQKPNPFGAPSAPAFGGPSQLGRGAFGQPSALGQKPNPFGASSSSTSGTSGGFSSFSGPGAFGAPSQSTPSGSFGNQNQLGGAFGAQTQPSSGSFGAPSPAASNPFGGSSAAVSTPNPFGQAAAPANPNPFGVAPTQPQSTSFGAAPVAQNNPFGGGTSTASSNPFGTPSNTQTSIKNPFGQNNGPVGSSLGSGSVNGQVGGYQQQQSGGHDVSTYSSRDGSGRLFMFKGKRVEYNDNEPGYIGHDGQWSRIFFPDGPPPNPIKTTTDPNDQYDAATETAYKQLLETGSFPEDNVPLLPPKKEWVRWDF
jgi:nucleoporin NUP42